MGSEQSSLDTENQIDLKSSTSIKFHLQNVEHEVKTEKIDPNTSLNFYLRKILAKTGTKGMCYEGGCGACVVVIQTKNATTQKDQFLAVNSCLMPLLSCNGLRIITVEGIGDPVNGYHPIQEILAKFNGTQCGFCSPGMVMNMYALYESQKMTMAQIEKSFGGNICRCTGYRSILAAFKSLAQDATVEIVGECGDIEDIRQACRTTCVKHCEQLTEPFSLSFSTSQWIKVYTLTELLGTLSRYPTSTYKLVAGNTAQGVYKTYQGTVELYIDINDVGELKVEQVNDNYCVLGAATTLADAIEFFYQTAKKSAQFSYFKLLADHVEMIANVPVRNRATLGGNLMIKHDHHDFPSDIFLILETVGATLSVVNLSGEETKLSPLQFINSNMNQQVLKTVTLPTVTGQTRFKSFKIMARAQNTHALVNAGFLFKFSQNNLLQAATIVYGNINDNFVHASQTESLLVGKNLFDNSTLQQAYRSLDGEVDPSDMPPEPAPKFRKQLSIALFYKAVLSLAPDGKVSARNKSGGTMIERPISKGAQDYETNKSLYPLTEAIPKIEALAQTSGQAQYIEDMPDLPHQLFGALVLAECPPNSTITHIDATRALRNENIVAFYTPDDIPGNNTITYSNAPVSTAEEEIFCKDKTVKYYEQPVGVLIGRSQEAVDNAVALVEVSYDPPTAKPLLTVRQVLDANSKDRITEYKVINAKRKGNEIKRVIKGKFDIYHQYHFHMETQCCIAIPNENGLDVHPSTQWMHMSQRAIAKMLDIPLSQVTVHVRRCGGGFGAKLTRNGFASCAAALAAWKLKKPVNIRLPLTTNMGAIGKRFPCTANYEVGVNNAGMVQYLNCGIYTDVGFVFNGDSSIFIEKVFTNTYTEVADTFTLSMNRVRTDTQTNTWMRAPGSIEGVALIETIMEHIAYEVNADPMSVRLANLPQKSPLLPYITDMKSWSNIAQRRSEIATFNKQNRWRKKGIAFVPMVFDTLPLGPHLATVSIFHGDGSVQISHGGIEIGQGINTKAAQTCAYKFQIPLEQVTILPGDSFISANNIASGGSITTDGVCYSIDKACDELLERIKPYRSDGAKWGDVIKKSYENGVNLVATGKYAPQNPDVKAYSIYGVCVVEVEVDILTGKYMVSRVYINEDTGRSLNPVIDIGQVEGAFIMGLGYQTMEEIIFSWEGQVLTNRTWTYYPPGAQDIPVDLNVKLQKNNPNPIGVLKSKGTGEPATCFAIAIQFAIRNAVSSARTDASPSNKKWYRIDGPSTVADVFTKSLNDYKQYVL